MLCIISCQNVVLKYNTRVWREYLQQKYQIISRINTNTKKLFFFLCIYKMYLISAEGYKNPGVHCLRIKKTGELWVNMKNVRDALGVTNISDLVLKEIKGIYEKKELTK